MFLSHELAAELEFHTAKVTWVFYQHHKNSRELLSDSSTSRSLYLRVLALGCFDLLLVFPFNTISVIVGIQTYTTQLGPLPFCQGWTAVHASWKPIPTPYTEFLEGGRTGGTIPSLVDFTSALTIVALFGFTANARAAYRCWGSMLLRSLRIFPLTSAIESFGEMVFTSRQDNNETTFELTPM